jgi:histidine triad (HIT) family protein
VRSTAFDKDAYEQRVRSGPCFVCATVAGDPEYRHEVVWEDDEHVAFLSRDQTMPGYVLACPKAHVQHILRDLDDEAYARLMRFVRAVGLAVEAVIAPDRTYLLSLGSQQGNDHVHWHIAPLPAGVPYEQQQYYALMAENGLIATTPDQKAELAARIREQLRRA